MATVPKPYRAKYAFWDWHRLHTFNTSWLLHSLNLQAIEHWRAAKASAEYPLRLCVLSVNDAPHEVWLLLPLVGLNWEETDYFYLPMIHALLSDMFPIYLLITWQLSPGFSLTELKGGKSHNIIDHFWDIKDSGEKVVLRCCGWLRWYCYAVFSVF